MARYLQILKDVECSFLIRSGWTPYSTKNQYLSLRDSVKLPFCSQSLAIFVLKKIVKKIYIQLWLINNVDLCNNLESFAKCYFGYRFLKNN